jgi:THO complex subunit 2 N-terminus
MLGQSPDVTEMTPRQLYLTAALFIREDFITLDDLYPHLSPSDDDLETKGYKAYLASIDASIDSAKISQLAMAAPLESSSQPGSSRLAPPHTARPLRTSIPPLSQEPDQARDVCRRYLLQLSNRASTTTYRDPDLAYQAPLPSQPRLTAIKHHRRLRRPPDSLGPLTALAPDALAPALAAITPTAPAALSPGLAPGLKAALASPAWYEKDGSQPLAIRATGRVS